MPPASNLGGQNNLILFEVGMIRRNPLAPELPPLVRVLGLHPLLVVPEEISYDDSSRSNVDETGAGGAFMTVGGRALRTVTMRGTFGVEDRALGLYFGNGDLRFAKFYHEVVRLPDAITRDHVSAEKDPFRSPILSLLLLPYDEETSTFYVNYYDFWHGVSGQFQVTRFTFSKAARRGAATGLTQYNLSLREVGPLVTGSLVTALLAVLFKAIGVWSTLNDQIASFRLDVIAEGVANLAGVVVQQFVGSVNAVKSMADGATALLNGQATPGETIGLQTRGLFGDDSSTASGYSEDQDEAGIEYQRSDPENGTSGLGSYLSRSLDLAVQAQQLGAAVRAAHPDRAWRTPPGRIRWESEEGEGGVVELDAADSGAALGELEAAATAQQAMGALYGMSRAEFAAYLASTGRAGLDGLGAGTVSHRVGPGDTVASIERHYAVPWDHVLRANPELAPSTALLLGTVLRIPRATSIVATPGSGFQGLPTFGSHSGEDAWGRDLWVDLRTDGLGRVLVCSGADVVAQGINWIVREAEDELLEGANTLPPGQGREQYIQTKIGAMVATDPRIVSVDTVDVAADGPHVSVAVSATAINGGAVSTVMR